MRESNPCLLNILDRIAHPSTTGHDLDQSVAGLRRILHGGMPSELLRTPVRPVRTKHRSYDAFKAEIDDLRQKLKKAEDDKAISERERHHKIESLIDQITKMQLRLDEKTAEPEPRDFHTYDEVIQAMVRKFGKHHGVPAALAERNAGLLKSGAAIGKITASNFQQWRANNQFPLYVVEQINAMSSDDMLCRGPRWTEDERQYLVDLYTADPSRSNKTLADACSTQFGRLITECSIKGELDRQRKKGRVSPYRSLPKNTEGAVYD
jgi:hypothetical protein